MCDECVLSNYHNMYLGGTQVFVEYPKLQSPQIAHIKCNQLNLPQYINNRNENYTQNTILPFWQAIDVRAATLYWNKYVNHTPPWDVIEHQKDVFHCEQVSCNTKLF